MNCLASFQRFILRATILAAGGCATGPAEGGRSADRTFQDILKPLSAAESLGVNFKIDIDAPSGTSGPGKVFLGTLRLKPGNRVQALFHVSAGGVRGASFLVSDGRRMFVQRHPGDVFEQAPPQDIGRRIQELFASWGANGIFALVFGFPKPEGAQAADLQWRPMSPCDFQADAADEGRGTLRYRLKDPDGVLYASAVLWYAPRTRRLIQRVMTLAGSGSVVTETYEDLALNEPIPDEIFRSPENEK
ncbi:MAG: hypothetical protein HY293_01390 [Planctomycetes bacterium]|nr:hypothetical protein [Planctomycetota bacterium]